MKERNYMHTTIESQAIYRYTT